MFEDLPLFVLACTVVVYWGTVMLLVLAKQLRHGRGAGLLPSQAYERRLWLLIVPVVVAWILLPILAAKSHIPWTRLPSWASMVPPPTCVARTDRPPGNTARIPDRSSRSSAAPRGGPSGSERTKCKPAAIAIGAVRCQFIFCCRFVASKLNYGKGHDWAGSPAPPAFEQHRCVSSGAYLGFCPNDLTRTRQGNACRQRPRGQNSAIFGPKSRISTEA